MGGLGRTRRGGGRRRLHVRWRQTAGVVRLQEERSYREDNQTGVGCKKERNCTRGFRVHTEEKVSGLGKVLGLFKTWKLLQAELLQTIFLLRGQMWLSQIEMFMQECAEHPSQVDKLKPKHNPNSR